MKGCWWPNGFGDRRAHAQPGFETSRRILPSNRSLNKEYYHYQVLGTSPQARHANSDGVWRTHVRVASYYSIWTFVNSKQTHSLPLKYWLANWIFPQTFPSVSSLYLEFAGVDLKSHFRKHKDWRHFVMIGGLNQRGSPHHLLGHASQRQKPTQRHGRCGRPRRAGSSDGHVPMLERLPESESSLNGGFLLAEGSCWLELGHVDLRLQVSGRRMQRSKPVRLNVL